MNTKLGSNLSRLRKQAGLTQEDMAARLNVTRQTVSGWERNRCEPDLQTLNALAAVLSVSLEELAGNCAPARFVRFQKRHIHGAAIYLGVTVLWILLDFLLYGYLVKLTRATLINYKFYYRLYVPYFGWFTAGGLLVSAIAMLTDAQSLPQKWLGKATQCGLVAALPTLLLAAEGIAFAIAGAPVGLLTNLFFRSLPAFNLCTLVFKKLLLFLSGGLFQLYRINRRQ